MNRLLRLALCLVFAMTLAHTTFAQILTPQGRLTPTSNTPVITAETTGVSSVYYTPYVGNSVPIYNGTSFSNYTISQLTMTLNTSTHLSGDIYDLYLFYNTTTSSVQIGASSAWFSSTVRVSGGIGTQVPTLLNGVWVEPNGITLTNGTTSYPSIPANEATYVGSIYMTSNGETGVSLRPAAASGGSNNGINNVIGIFNAYNRVRVEARCLDNNSSWTYASTSFRAADSSTSNKITFLDGLGQIYIEARYQSLIAPSAQGGAVGVALDWTSGAPADIVGAHNSAATSQFNSEQGEMSAYPVTGLHSVQALEAANNTNTLTFYGTFSSLGQASGLFLDTEL